MASEPAAEPVPLPSPIRATVPQTGKMPPGSMNIRIGCSILAV